MGKNIVICIDGTGNEFGENNSNVVKLYSVLKCSDQTQIAYYHPGLGTMGSRNAVACPVICTGLHVSVAQLLS